MPRLRSSGCGALQRYVPEPLFDVLDGTPSRVLDIGCAGGAFGAALVQRFPEASVVGIEAGRAAAERALRFFTLAGIRRLFVETGYDVEADRAIILPALAAVYRSYQGRTPAAIRIGRMTVADVTPPEVVELCAAQFVTRARRRPS